MLRVQKIIATGFGSGYSPIAPGTAGALVACLILWALNVVFEGFSSTLAGGGIYFLGLILLFTIMGVMVSHQLEAEWGKDASRIVVDEIVGMWIAMVMVPFNWQYLLAGFILFRFFDILKPFYIRKMEALPGGWGVMMDDVLAGVYANFLLHMAILIVPEVGY